jgi:hypothetical protein
MTRDKSRVPTGGRPMSILLLIKHVISLFVARYIWLDRYELWQSLALPLFISATAKGCECREIVNDDG